MTETTMSLLPGSDPGDEIVSGARSPARAKVLAVGVALAVALAAGGWVLLGTGEQSDDLALGVPPVAAPPQPDAAATVAPSPSSSPSAAPAAVARDPFAPQVSQAAPAAVPVPPASSSGTGTGTDAGTGAGTGAALPGSPVLGGGPVGEGSTGAGAGDPPPLDLPGAPQAAGQRLALVAVAGAGDERTAVFTLGGLKLTAAVGEDFGPASALLLLSIQQGPQDGQWTAVVQREQGEPFDVVTGAPVTVP